jgi:hypothetical protein
VVRVNGEERGTSPVSVALPIGQEVVVTLKAPGFAEASRTITATATTAAQRISLTRLPYVLKVETNAPNPAIGALRRTPTRRRDRAADRARRAFQVAVMADGFTRATRDLRAADFVEENGAMRFTVQVPLTPTRGARAPHARRPGRRSQQRAAADAHHDRHARGGDPEPSAHARARARAGPRTEPAPPGPRAAPAPAAGE